MARERLRADAERNRTLIVAAARDAFAEEGIDVAWAEIARRAGVGFATVQRRFPTKPSLIAEVLKVQLAGISDTAARNDVEDPWEAFAGPIRACCQQQAEQPGLAGPLAEVISAAKDPAIRQPIADAFDRLAARARSDGMLREDITVEDVLTILKANAGIVASSPGHEGEASRRFVELMLDSFRRS